MFKNWDFKWSIVVVCVVVISILSISMINISYAQASDIEIYGTVYEEGTDTTVTYNNIFSNTEYGVFAIEPDSPPVGIGPLGVNARYCWWGASDGPSGVGTGGGDAVSSYVIYNPYATTPWP